MVSWSVLLVLSLEISIVSPELSARTVNVVKIDLSKGYDYDALVKVGGVQLKNGDWFATAPELDADNPANILIRFPGNDPDGYNDLAITNMQNGTWSILDTDRNGNFTPCLSLAQWGVSDECLFLAALMNLPPDVVFADCLSAANVAPEDADKIWETHDFVRPETRTLTWKTGSGPNIPIHLSVIPLQLNDKTHPIHTAHKVPNDHQCHPWSTSPGPDYPNTLICVATPNGNVQVQLPIDPGTDTTTLDKTVQWKIVNDQGGKPAAYTGNYSNMIVFTTDAGSRITTQPSSFDVNIVLVESGSVLQTFTVIALNEANYQSSISTAKLLIVGGIINAMPLAEASMALFLNGSSNSICVPSRTIPNGQQVPITYMFWTHLTGAPIANGYGTMPRNEWDLGTPGVNAIMNSKYLKSLFETSALGVAPAVRAQLAAAPAGTTAVQSVILNGDELDFSFNANDDPDLFYAIGRFIANQITFTMTFKKTPTNSVILDSVQITGGTIEKLYDWEFYDRPVVRVKLTRLMACLEIGWGEGQGRTKGRIVYNVFKLSGGQVSGINFTLP